MYETMILNWDSTSNPSPSRVLGVNEFTMFLEQASIEEKKQFLKQDCDIKIVGISQQIQINEKVRMLMAMKAFAESPIFAQMFKPKKLLDEIAGSMGEYNAPYIKTDAEMNAEAIGQQLMMALGKMVVEGGPEKQAEIVQFLKQTLSGGNGGEVAGGIPAIPAEGTPFPTG